MDSPVSFLLNTVELCTISVQKLIMVTHHGALQRLIVIYNIFNMGIAKHLVTKKVNVDSKIHPGAT